MTDIPDEPFHCRDLPELGLSRHQLDDLVAAGVVRRVVRSVYVRSDIEDTIALRARCASLVLPPHVVVSDRSAAWLHGIDAYDLADLAFPPDLEVVSIDGNEPTRREGFLGGKRELLPEDVCEVHGVATTTPLRTACDLACLYGRPTALAVLDAFMRHHGLTHEDFERILPRFRKRRGVKQLRELIKYACADAESAGESWTRMRIHDASLPRPTPNTWVHLEGYGWVRLDLAYVKLKIAVEYDGEEFHTKASDKVHDEERRAALRRAGWIVIVVTKDDLSGDALWAWLDELRQALAVRRPAATRRYSRGESWTDRPRRRRTSGAR
jgi:hypothetical protein